MIDSAGVYRGNAWEREDLKSLAQTLEYALCRMHNIEPRKLTWTDMEGSSESGYATSMGNYRMWEANIL
jgi:hypothetical protein